MLAREPVNADGSGAIGPARDASSAVKRLRASNGLNGVLALQRAAGNRATTAVLGHRTPRRPPGPVMTVARYLGGRACGSCQDDGVDAVAEQQRQVVAAAVARRSSARRGTGTLCRQSDDATVTLPEITVFSTSPASLRSAIGSPDYYRMRRDDFVARNPDESPPDYYMGYGDKYARRFVTSLRPRLSSAGQRWLDCTLNELQGAMEDKRDANPWAFAVLEEDNDAFRHFAYGTHQAVYVDCGLCELNILDETEIAFTPDFTDSFFSGTGIEQILAVFADCQVHWFYPAGPAIE